MAPVLELDSADSVAKFISSPADSDPSQLEIDRICKPCLEIDLNSSLEMSNIEK
jgi:hypothetical protein